MWLRQSPGGSRRNLCFCGFALPQVCVEPGESALQAVEAQVGRAGAGEAVVRVGRIADVFDGAAEAAEGGEELVRLLDRAAEIALAVQDQERRPDAAGEEERRGCQVGIWRERAGDGGRKVGAVVVVEVAGTDVAQ